MHIPERAKKYTGASFANMSAADRNFSTTF